MAAGRSRRGGGLRRGVGGGRDAPRRGVAQRSTRKTKIRRGASPKMAARRDLRRRQSRRQSQAVAPRPRPVVRPVRPAMRVMPKARPRPVRPGLPATSRRRPASRAGVAAGAAAAAGAFLALKTSSAHADIAADVASIQNSLDDLQERAGFTRLEADIADLDATLNHALSLLESARDKGFRYQKDLEDLAYEAMSRWQEIQEGVRASVREQAEQAQAVLKPVDKSVQRLNAALGSPSKATPLLGSLQNEIDRALDRVSEAERAVEKAYADIETQAYQLNSRLTTIHWALTQLEEATFELEKDEDLVMAVAARWDQEGKEDPEGVLYLSNRRLIFERKEKVATKKVLFVTTASELVQETSIDQPLEGVKGVKAESKGLFGHQDFLEVKFSDAKLGTVSFHLSGQDSEDWSRLVDDARSGDIEKDRATGSGLSFTDLTGELTSADIVALQGEVNELQDEVMLKDLRQEVAELENSVASLKRDLSKLRSRGYAIEKSLEADVEVLAAQWERVKARAEATLEHQAKLLGEQMSEIQKMMKELAGRSDDPQAARPLFVQLKSAVASAEAQAEAAEDTVLKQYDEYADEVEALSAHFDWVAWMLDAISTASFKLLATESGVAATEAVWERPGLEPENGVLFLTDQRWLWEDRVGDFELKLDLPLQELKDLKQELDEDSGAEYLLSSFGSQAPVRDARFRLALPVGEAWLQMAGRAQSGDYAKDRAIELDEKDLERIRNAPQQCSNCGGAFTAPILRGQTEITCEYCGVVTRI